MKINYSFVEFHSPVFSRGKNHGTKIHARESGVESVKLYYDTEIRFMCMEYKGKISHFDTFHSADVIQEEAPKKVSVNVPIETKPHHASKEAKAARALTQASQGE